MKRSAVEPAQWLRAFFLIMSVVLTSAGATACSVSVVGELGAIACDNDADDDGDRLWDCEDPDCWSTDVCLKDDPVHLGQLDASLLGTGDAATSDASPELIDPPLQSDSGDGGGGMQPPSLVDSGNPDLTCDMDGGPTCLPVEVCEAGKCVPHHLYLVRVTGAVVPDRTPNGACYDGLLDNNSWAACATVATICMPCMPDPYVILALNGDEIDRTSTQVDRLGPSWDGAPLEVRITPDDRLTVIVMDDETLPGSADQRIFHCEIDTVSPVGEGRQCRPSDDQVADTTKYSVTVEMTPKVVTRP